MNVKNILFVCTGNSCRSVMAQDLTRHLLDKAGIKDIEVSSAGVFALEGMLATIETRQVLESFGVNPSEHRARSLTYEMVHNADLILAMEIFHLEEILRRFPEAKDKVHLLKNFKVDSEVEGIRYQGIADPIGKPLEVYEICFSEIREAIERILPKLLPGSE